MVAMKRYSCRLLANKRIFSFEILVCFNIMEETANLLENLKEKWPLLWLNNKVDDEIEELLL